MKGGFIVNLSFVTEFFQFADTLSGWILLLTPKEKPTVALNIGLKSKLSLKSIVSFVLFSRNKLNIFTLSRQFFFFSKPTSFICWIAWLSCYIGLAQRLREVISHVRPAGAWGWVVRGGVFPWGLRSSVWDLLNALPRVSAGRNQPTWTNAMSLARSLQKHLLHQGSGPLLCLNNGIPGLVLPSCLPLVLSN